MPGALLENWAIGLTKILSGNLWRWRTLIKHWRRWKQIVRSLVSSMLRWLVRLDCLLESFPDSLMVGARLVDMPGSRCGWVNGLNLIPRGVPILLMRRTCGTPRERCLRMQIGRAHV